jgi:hypothetical protein
MVGSGQAGYDGPVMNDLPVPDSCPPIFRIGKNPREDSRALREEWPESQQEQSFVGMFARKI